jgi:hypothetical protein
MMLTIDGMLMSMAMTKRIATAADEMADDEEREKSSSLRRCWF